MNFTADFSQPYILNLSFPDVTAYRPGSDKNLHLTLNNMLGSLQVPFGFYNIYVEPSTFGANLKKQSYPMNNGYIAVLGSPLFNSPLNDFQYANISVSNCPNFSQNIIQTEGNIQINNCANFDADLAAINGNVYVGNCPNFNKPLSFCNKQYDFKYHSGSGVITNCPNFNSSVNIHANNAQCGTMYNLIKSNLPKGDVFVNGGIVHVVLYFRYEFDCDFVKFMDGGIIFSYVVPLVVATLAMLVDVETLFLNTLVNSKSCKFLDCSKEDDTATCSPKVYNKNTECLSSEESKSVTIETAFAD